MIRLSAVLTAALMLPAPVSAQSSDPAITTAVVTNPRQMTVVFSEALTTSATAPQFDVARVRLLPDNVVPVSVQQNSLARDTFTLNFAAVPETATRVCFDQVQFGPSSQTASSAAQVCAELSRDPAALKATWLAALTEVPRASRQKPIFASGFVTTASNESSGGADLALNPSFNIPNLNAFLQIKKATADEGDARNFEAGARYRFTRTWRPGQLSAIAVEDDAQRLNELIRARQRNIFAGWLIDVAGKLEGDPTEFDVTNFVGESSVHLQTMTKGFVGRRGFWRGFVAPAGIEVGQSLGTTVPGEPGEMPEIVSPTVNRIARYKLGGGLTVYYDNPAAQFPLRRIEVDVNGVLRHLFLSESRFNDDTQRTDLTDDGLQGYAQVDLKVFFGETEAGRYGFKVSYNRGRLPPVYADVKSFDFGFIIESGGGDSRAVAVRRAGPPVQR
jgi:hypothetical protein